MNRNLKPVVLFFPAVTTTGKCCRLPSGEKKEGKKERNESSRALTDQRKQTKGAISGNHRLPQQRFSVSLHLLGQLPGLLRLASVSAAGLVQSLRPVADDADVGAEVVLLRRRGQGERMPLQSGNRRALDEDVLAHLHAEVFPFHLQLQSFGRVHHHLADRGRYQ